MAPKGLPTVEQKFTADASGYIAAIHEMIVANEDLVQSIGQVQGMIDDLRGKDVKINVDTKQALADIAKVKSALDGLGDRTIHIRAVGDAIGDVGDNLVQAARASTETVRGLRDVSDELGKLHNAGDRAGTSVEKTAEAVQDLSDVLGRAEGLGLAARELERIAGSMARMDADNLSAAAAHLDSMAGNASRAEAAMEQVAHVQERIIRQANEIGTRAGSIWDNPRGVIPGMGDVPSPWIQGVFPGPAFVASPRNLGTRAGDTWGNTLPGMGAVPRAWEQGVFPGMDFTPSGGPWGRYGQGVPFGGGGGPPWIPPIGDLWAPGPPGDKGGGGIGWLAAVMSKARPSTIFGGATATLAGAHLATMLTMEVASQVVPAAVAALAAGAVGFQGGKYATLRGMGIYAAGEAMAGAYGTTNGQLFGMGGGFQTAQNQATGGIYGIIGSLMQMGRGSAGPGGLIGPGGMGVQTVAMINRGLANMVGSGRAAQIGQAVGGGTGALQTIGDIFGNLGDSILNLAPVLPGMGSVLFGGLKAGTGALRSITDLAHGPSLLPLLFGSGLAAEAGWRWGGPILGGGKLPWFLGGSRVKGLAGLAARMGAGTLPMSAEEVVAAGLAPDLAAAGAGEAGTGLAGLLAGGVAGLPIAGLAAIAAAGAYGISQSTFGTPAANTEGGYMRSINASFGAGSLAPISQALYQSGGQASNIPGTFNEQFGGQNLTVGVPIAQLMRSGMSYSKALATVQAQYAANVSNNANQMGQMTAAGGNVLTALNSLHVKGATLAQAFDYMTMAMISPKDVGPGGKLDKTAMQQLSSFVSAYSLMGSGGAIGGRNASAVLSASSADYIMSTEPVKKLSQINSALDSMTQIMTGGPAAASGLFQVSAAAPALVAQAMATAPGGRLSREQLNQIAQVQAGKPSAAHQLVASALAQGPFTTAGAAAWQQFAGPQGIISGSQAMMDQFRTYETMGGLSGVGMAQLGAYELKHFVAPYATQSPMALAMLQQQAMQAGIPGVKMGQSFKQTQAAINAAAPSTGRANQLMTQGTQAVANIPGVANFLNPNANVSPLASAEYAAAAADAMATARHPTAGNVRNLMSDVSMMGAKPGQMTIAVDAILKNLHVPKDLVAKVNEVMGTIVHPKVQPLHAQIIYTNHMPGKPSVPTLYGAIIYTASIVGLGSTRSISGGGATIGSLGGHTAQHGMLVPGSGSGDIVPAMLEPGELVVPRSMVQAGMVSHLQGRIPGYAAGGVIPELGGLAPFEISTVGAIGALAHTVNALTQAIMAGGFSTPVMKIFAAGAKTQQSNTFWGQFGREIMLGLIEGIKNAKGETKQAAQALVNSVAQEVTYGKNIAAAAKQGTGFNPWGGGQTLLSTFTGLATPQMTAQGQPYQYYIDQANAGQPGQAPLSVQGQMSDYLQAEKSFQGDLGKLSKQGLNKNLMQQLLAAGPIAGDQMAQSILSGPGGVKGANSLWAQINKASNQLGVTGASAVAGTGGKVVHAGVVTDPGPVHALQAAIDGLHGKTVTVRVNVVTGGGGGGTGLSKSQLKAVTEQVQARLLVQAKNNRHTGIMLPGYSA